MDKPIQYFYGNEREWYNTETKIRKCSTYILV